MYFTDLNPIQFPKLQKIISEDVAIAEAELFYRQVFPKARKEKERQIPVPKARLYHFRKEDREVSHFEQESIG